MTALWSILGSNCCCALLLLLQIVSQLPAGADADGTTWKRCKTVANGKYERVVTYPLDINATFLSIAKCELTEIHPSDFNGLPEVSIIWLQENDLTQLHPSTFRSVPKLNQLYLSSNKLREFPVFDENSLPNLSVLHVRDNLLTGIYDPRTFLACVHLRKLKIGRNKIEYLHPDVFKPLLELTDLDLHRNRITSLPATMFGSNTKLIFVEFHKNNIAQLPANFASELKKTGVEAVEFNSDNWQCECLLELMSDSKRAGLGYFNEEILDYDEFVRNGFHDSSVAHYDGTRPECVFSGYVPAPQIKYKLFDKIQCTRE